MIRVIILASIIAIIGICYFIIEMKPITTTVTTVKTTSPTTTTILLIASTLPTTTSTTTIPDGLKRCEEKGGTCRTNCVASVSGAFIVLRDFIDRILGLFVPNYAKTVVGSIFGTYEVEIGGYPDYCTQDLPKCCKIITTTTMSPGGGGGKSSYTSTSSTSTSSTTTSTTTTSTTTTTTSTTTTSTSTTMPTTTTSTTASTSTSTIPSGNWLTESLSLNFWASDVMLNGTTVIAGSADNGDIYKSTNEGLTWTKIWNIPNATRVEMVFVDSRGTIFISASTPKDVESGLYRSTNGGQSFTKVWRETAQWKNYSYVPPDGMTEDDQGNLYFGTRCREGGPTDVYKSTDGGATWTKIYSFTQAKHFHFLRFNTYNKWMYAGLGDPGNRPDGNPNFPDAGLWRSKDYGQTWVRLDIGRDPYNQQWHTWDIMGIETYQNYIYLTVHWSRGQLLRILDDGISTSFTPEAVYTTKLKLLNWARLYKGQHMLTSGEVCLESNINMGVWASSNPPFNSGTWQYAYEDGWSNDYKGCACASHRISNNGWLFVANTIAGHGVRMKYT